MEEKHKALKHCKGCEQDKDELDFYVTASSCKQCHSKKVIKNQTEKKKYYNRYRNEYAKKHPEKIKAWNKNIGKPKVKKTLKTKAQAREYSKQYYQKNRDSYIAYALKHFWVKRMKEFEAKKKAEEEIIKQKIQVFDEKLQRLKKRK